MKTGNSVQPDLNLHTPSFANVYARGIIGVMYALDQGVPHNDVEAVKCYRLAADRGNAASQLALARMYETGRGVPQSDVEAVTWYRRETNLGAPDYITAYMWFELSAAQGDQVAVSDRDAAARRMTPAQIAEAWLQMFDPKCEIIRQDIENWSSLAPSEAKAFCDRQK
jgi:TPR repeat protein